MGQQTKIQRQKILRAMLSARRRSAPEDYDQGVARARLRSQGVTIRPSPKVSWLLSTEGHTSASYFACIVCGAIRNPNPHCSDRFNSDHLPRCRHHPARGGRGPGRPSYKIGPPHVFQEFACAPGPHTRKCPFHPDNFAQAGGAAVLETGLPTRKRFANDRQPEMVIMDFKCGVAIGRRDICRQEYRASPIQVPKAAPKARGPPKGSAQQGGGRKRATEIKDLHANAARWQPAAAKRCRTRQD